MTFVIENRYNVNSSLLKSRTYLSARDTILRFPMLITEQIIDQKLYKLYGLNLKPACLYLLARCKFLKNKDNNLIVSFPDKADNKLAMLITYGDGSFVGSNILKLALS